MKHKHYSFILVTCLLLFSFSAICQGQVVEITGIVVAYVPCAPLGGSEPVPIQTLLIHVEKVLSGKVGSKYIIASCYYQGDQYIKTDTFDGKSAWYFKLEPNHLDPFIKFRDVLYVRTLDAETEKLIREDVGMTFLVDQKIIKAIGVNTELPCYRFQKGDYKTSIK